MSCVFMTLYLCVHSFMSLCVCVCMCMFLSLCVHVHKCVHAYMHVCVCFPVQPEINLKCFPSLLSSSFFEARSLSLDPDSPLPCFSQTSWPVNPQDLPVTTHSPSTGATSLAFTWLLGIKLQGFLSKYFTHGAVCLVPYPHSLPYQTTCISFSFFLQLLLALCHCRPGSK